MYYPIKSILSISPFSLHNENSTDLQKTEGKGKQDAG